MSDQASIQGEVAARFGSKRLSRMSHDSYLVSDATGRVKEMQGGRKHHQSVDRKKYVPTKVKTPSDARAILDEESTRYRSVDEARTHLKDLIK